VGDWRGTWRCRGLQYLSDLARSCGNGL